MVIRLQTRPCPRAARCRQHGCPAAGRRGRHRVPRQRHDPPASPTCRRPRLNAQGASDLLMMPKDMLLDDEIRASTIALSTATVAYMLSNFQACMGAVDGEGWPASRRARAHRRDCAVLLVCARLGGLHAGKGRGAPWLASPPIAPRTPQPPAPRPAAAARRLRARRHPPARCRDAAARGGGGGRGQLGAAGARGGGGVHLLQPHRRHGHGAGERDGQPPNGRQRQMGCPSAPRPCAIV